MTRRNHSAVAQQVRRRLCDCAFEELHYARVRADARAKLVDEWRFELFNG